MVEFWSVTEINAAPPAGSVERSLVGAVGSDQMLAAASAMRTWYVVP